MAGQGTMVYEIRRGNEVAPLFEGWQETMIWSCLQNVMGHLYAAAPEQPDAAMAMIGDFCFLLNKRDRSIKETVFTRSVNDGKLETIILREEAVHGGKEILCGENRQDNRRF